MVRGVAMVLFIGLAACADGGKGQVGQFDVELARDQGSFTARHKNGGAVFATAASAFSVRKASASYETQFGAFKIAEQVESDWRVGAELTEIEQEDGVISAVVTDSEGERIGDVRISPANESLRIEFTSDETRARIGLVCDAASAGGFVGFGAQTYDVDHRGQIVPIFVSEQGIGKIATDELPDVWFLTGNRHQSYLPVPTLIAPRAGASWGVHATTERRSIWDVCATDPSRLEIEVWEGRLELLVAPGPSPLQVLSQLTEHLGRIPPPPAWTFGVWMEAVGGTAVVRAEAQALRDAHIAATAIWSEDWRGGERSGNDYILAEDWRADGNLYPGLAGLIDELHALGFRFQIYFNTFVTDGADVSSEVRTNGWHVRDRRAEPYRYQAPNFEEASMLELFDDGAREFMKSELVTALGLGADGWMADFAEWYPADPKTVAPPNGLAAESAHQRYPVAWAEVNREAVEASGRDDVVIFHRSGYSGAQGKAHVIWAGDQRTSFQDDDGLPTVIPIMLGLGATGFPIVTHDIGGYSNVGNGPTDKELFFRWTTLGALGPIMRTHHGRAAFENWRWSSDAETIAHFRRWSKFHTRLFPYFVALGKQASDSGTPMQAPLALHYPSEVRLHGTKDQYMLGPELMVAPIVTAGVTSRSVALPPGRWFDLFSGAAFEGSRDITVELPLGEIGVYARAGAMVPVLSEDVEALEPTDAVLDAAELRGKIEVWVWLGAGGGAIDLDGGVYTLVSGGAPSAERFTVAGGTVLDASVARELLIEGMPNATLTLTEPTGELHELRSQGTRGDLEIRYRIRW